MHGKRGETCSRRHKRIAWEWHEQPRDAAECRRKAGVRGDQWDGWVSAASLLTSVTQVQSHVDSRMLYFLFFFFYPLKITCLPHPQKLCFISSVMKNITQMCFFLHFSFLLFSTEFYMFCFFFFPNESPATCSSLLDFSALHYGGRVELFKWRLIWRALAHTYTEALSVVLIVCVGGWDAFPFLFFFFFMTSSSCFF